jgi:hypothetical protein
MSFKNIAKYGYQQTVAGVWSLGGGMTMNLKIEDPRGTRFIVEFMGPTTQRMKDFQRASAFSGVSLEGPTADGASSRPRLSRRGAGAIALADAVLAAATFSPTKYVRVQRIAHGIGAPMYHGSAAEKERMRSTIQEALAARDSAGRNSVARGFGTLGWIGENYMDVLNCGPYFVEDGSRWWETGIIAMEHNIPAVVGSSAQTPMDVLLRVRTDLYGKTLYMHMFFTRNHRVIKSHTGVYNRGTEPSVPDHEVKTIEFWE